MERYLTIKEVAEAMRVRTPAVRRLAKDGKIRMVRFARRTLIAESWLQEYLDPKGGAR